MRYSRYFARHCASGLDVPVRLAGVVLARRRLAAVLLVEVVAERDDEVEVLLRGDRRLRREVAVLVALAGEEPDPHGLARIGGARACGSGPTGRSSSRVTKR